MFARSHHGSHHHHGHFTPQRAHA